MNLGRTALRKTTLSFRGLWATLTRGGIRLGYGNCKGNAWLHALSLHLRPFLQTRKVHLATLRMAALPQRFQPAQTQGE